MGFATLITLLQRAREHEYTPTRAGANPSRFLEGFNGKLQADGYAGYNAVAKRDTVVRVGCHAHVRRYFEKAVAHYPEAMEMLEFYRQLFEIERICSENKSTPLRRRIRSLRSRPLLDAMKAWMEGKHSVNPISARTSRWVT